MTSRLFGNVNPRVRLFSHVFLGNPARLPFLERARGEEQGERVRCTGAKFGGPAPRLHRPPLRGRNERAQKPGQGPTQCARL